MKKILIIVFILINTIPVLSRNYWQEVTLPDGYESEYWLDIYFFPGQEQYGWACSQDGKVIRTTDGGNSWRGSTVIPPGQYGHLESIHFPSTTVGYTSGQPGIFKTTDGGITWYNISPAQFDDIWGCYFIDINVGFAIGGGCGNNKQEFWKTTNGGMSWTVFEGSELNTGLTDLIFVSENHGYATSSGILWETTDQGDSWSVFCETSQNPVNTIKKVWQEEITKYGNSFLFPYSGVTCSGGGNTGGARFTTDFGQSWNEYETGKQMFGAFLLSAEEGWICGRDRSVYHTTNAGQDWKLKNCGIRPGHLDDTWFYRKNGKWHGWVVGSSGVYKLAESEIEVTKSEMDFGTICYPDNKLDTLYVQNLSFDMLDGYIQLLGDDKDNFVIINPTYDDILLPQCGLLEVIIMFTADEPGNKSAQLQIKFQSGEDYRINLKGSAEKLTARPLDTLQQLYPAYCGQDNPLIFEWLADDPGNMISLVELLNGDDDFILQESLPMNIFTDDETEMVFTINPPDTGWYKARYNVRLTPCDKDTTITMMAYGVSPIIFSDDNRVIYTKCNPSITDTIQIINKGNYQLVIPSMEIEDSYAFEIVGWADGSENPAVIQPNQTKELVVLFNPDAGGNYDATLVIENNDSTRVNGPKNPHRIHLHGAYEASKLFSEDSVINFGNVCLGSFETNEINISNLGNLSTNVFWEDDTWNDNFIFKFGSIDNGGKIFKEQEVNAFVTLNAQNLGELKDTIYLRSDACDDSLMIVIMANVYNNKFEVKPNKIEEFVQTGNTISREVKIIALGNTDILINQMYLEPEPEDWTINLDKAAPLELKTGDTIVVALTITPLVSTNYVGKLVIKGEGPDCDVEEDVLINLVSKDRWLTADLDSIDFGFIKCESDIVKETITFSNNSMLDDTVTSIRFNPEIPQFYIENKPGLPAYVRVGQSLPITITFNPNDIEGEFETELIVDTKMPGGQTHTKKIKGKFQKPIISISENSFDFGDIERCSPVMSESFIIENIGQLADELYLDGDIISGINFNETEFILASGEQVMVEFSINPAALIELGRHEISLNLISRNCGDSYPIEIAYNLIEPRLTYNPNSIDINPVWIDEYGYGTIKVYNNSGYKRNITDIQILPEDAGFVHSAAFPFDFEPGQDYEIPIEFYAAREGNFAAELIVVEESVCIDTIKIPLSAFVPEEKYDLFVYFPDYVVDAGASVDIQLILDNPIPKVKPDEITMIAEFDQYLFNPIEAYLNISGRQLDFDFYGNTLSISAEGEDLNEIFQREGKIITISGTALASIPSKTPLRIVKFDQNSKKRTILETKDGSLEIIGMCEPVVKHKIILLPEMNITSTNTIASNRVEFKAYSSEDQEIRISLTDILGNTVETWNKTILKGENAYDINIQHLPSGAYQLMFESDYNQHQSYKVIILR